MGKKSKTKGSTYEREVAAILREAGFNARRTAQYCGNTGEASDVVGLDYCHIECKRYANRGFDYEWLKQATWDSAEAAKRRNDEEYFIPVVIHRTDREKSVVTMWLDDFLDMYREYEASVYLDTKHEN